MAGIYPIISFTSAGPVEICYLCKLLHSRNEYQLNVELSGVLSGKILFPLQSVNQSAIFSSYNSTYFQIAKLSMIPVSCLLEIVFDKVRYSRDTKLSIVLVLIGVGVCTVTDVSVNTKGFVAALIAVWSTALQQYVSSDILAA